MTWGLLAACVVAIVVATTLAVWAVNWVSPLSPAAGLRRCQCGRAVFRRCVHCSTGGGK